MWQKVKWRLIYDLRAFNIHSNDPNFSMETAADIPLIARDCILGCKIDLKSAYWQIPLAADLQAFMGCHVDGQSMTWRCLPFGLAIAPRLFTSILRPLVLAWRSRGIRVLAYLDDIAVFAPDATTHARHLAIVLRDLQSAGLRVAHDKAFLAPCSQFEMLGILVDLPAKAFSLTRERADRISSDATDLLAHDTCRAADLASFLGRVAFAGIVCPWLSYFRPELTRCLASACPNGLLDGDLPVPLSPGAKSELAWWVSHSTQVVTRRWRWSQTAPTTLFRKRRGPADSPAIDFTAASDASDFGVGLRHGLTGSHVFDEPLPDWLPPHSPSAARELYGLARLIETGRFPPRSTIRLIVDSQAAVGSWVGPSVTPLTARAARRLFVAVTSKDLDVFIDWLSRDDLFDVDAGSRQAARDMAHAMVPTTWISSQLRSAFNHDPPDAELFASCHNRSFPHVPCGSRHPDPDAALGDGLSTAAWTRARRGWAFPPFALIRPVIRHIRSLAPFAPRVALLLPDCPLVRTLTCYSFRPGPPHLLAPPDFIRTVPPQRPLVLCVPS